MTSGVLFQSTAFYESLVYPCIQGRLKSRFTYTRQCDLLLLWVRFFKPIFELMLCDFLPLQ